MRNILFGNGINIQYGGVNKYSNAAIIKRLITNIQSGKYAPVIPDMNSGEILNLFNSLADRVKNIADLESYADGLFMLMEIERIKNHYTIDTPVENIGFEDLFIVLDLVCNSYSDSEIDREDSKRGVRMLFLDSIYDDGQINNLTYSDGLRRMLSRYDNVFTLNYDLNLERYFNDVNYLHGQFDVLAPEFDPTSSFSLRNPEDCRSNLVVPGFEHMYCNAIMSWFWLDKYGQWIDKESIYGADKFKRMNGNLDIVGMSPCNDEHLFIMINQSQISHVTYYYKTDDDKERMRCKIRKPITYTRVDRFWDRVL